MKPTYKTLYENEIRESYLNTFLTYHLIEKEKHKIHRETKLSILERKIK
mgnify:CR=1 FL=1